MFGVWVSGEKNWWNNNFYVSLIGDGITYSNVVSCYATTTSLISNEVIEKYFQSS